MKLNDAACPHCGEVIRAADGSIARTAIAIVLGLSAVSALSGCPSPPSAPKYGVPATEGPEPTATVGEPGPTPEPTVPEMAPKYGVPATPEPAPKPEGPEVRPLYGVPGTAERN